MRTTPSCAGLAEDNTIDSITAKGQEGVTQWGKFLLEIGRALNSAKCFKTLHDLAVQRDNIGSMLIKKTG